MLIKNALLALFGANAALVSGAAVLWPKGYLPTEAEHSAAVARAAELSLEGSQAAAATTSSLHARGVGSATGCVQVHCGAEKGTYPVIWKTFYQYTVWQDGKLLFYLMSADSGLFQEDSSQEWIASQDSQGHYWGFRAYGACNKFEYLNNIQSVYDWRTVDQVGNTHKLVDKNAGVICRESQNGMSKCNDATYWESVYSDSEACSGYSVPSFCDYRGRCVGNDELESVPQCKPGGEPCSN